MKHVKGVVLMLSLILSTHLKAEVVQNSFSPTFGPTYASTTVGEQDGWKFINLQRQPDAIYYGDGAVSIQTFGWDATGPLGYLTSPEKQDGVGWVTFWYKTHSPGSSYYANGDDFQLEILTSEDGVDFTSVNVVSVPYSDNTTWFCYSRVVNNLNAKYVRIQAQRHSSNNASAWIDLDEVIITDAVSSGVPAALLLSGSVEGEVGETTSITNKILVAGSGLTGDITLSLEQTGAAFALASETVTLSVGPTGLFLPVDFSPLAQDPVSGFAAIKNFYSCFVKVSGGGLPNLVFKVTGVGLERSITEPFELEPANYAYTYGTDNSFYYRGWFVERGSALKKSSYPDLVYEGNGAVRFFASLRSPKKTGGIGSISFKYRAEGNYSLEFDVYTSADNQNWTAVDHVTATANYTSYAKSINNDHCYVKLVPVDGSSSRILNVDAFVITEKGQSIPSASVQDMMLEAYETPYEFMIPITFSKITEDVSFSVSDPQVTLAVTSLPKARANGNYYLKATYNPEGDRKYVQTTLTIAGGGLPFAVQSKVTVYVLADRLATGFDGNWTSSYSGTVNTDEGWTVTASNRETGNNTAFGSAGALYANNNCIIISPPKSGGVGTVQFYAKIGSYETQSIINLSVSEEGIDWTPAGSITATNKAGYLDYEQTIDNPDAKFVKFEGTYFYIDNIVITAMGVPATKVAVVSNPVFDAAKGESKLLNVELQGTNITSDLSVRFKSGAAYSSTVGTIAAADINGRSYELPVAFAPAAGAALSLDTLVISSPELAFDYVVPLKGYFLKDIIYQNFNGTWIQGSSYDFYNIEGWESAYGNSRDGNNAYEGKAIQLTRSAPSSWNPTLADASLLAVPKSGGVGTIAFYYRTDNYDAADFRIRTYEALGGDATVVLDTVIPSNVPFTYYELVVNDPTAKYVEFVLLQPTSGYRTIYLDEIIITANGKPVPSASVTSEFLGLSAYAGETDSRTFTLSAISVEQEIRLTLASGAAFSIDQTTIMPENGTVETAIEVVYTPTEASFDVDTLWITSEGFLKPLQVMLLGNIPQDKLVEDFNEAGWAPDYTRGNYILHGWNIKNGMRTNSPIQIYEGEAGLQLRADLVYGENLGSLTSPVKSGGVNNASFYYRGEGMKLLLQTSQDGTAWESKDSLEWTGTTQNFALYQAVIKDKDAKYFRIQTKPIGTNSYWDVYIDSVVVDAMPYLRRVGAVQEINTTQTSLPITVQVAGVLNSNAAISINGEGFELSQKTNLTPEDVANGATASFDVIFTGGITPATKAYEAIIAISNEELETALEIPVLVNYTKPYLALVNPVTATQSTLTGSLVIPIELNGLLNTDASIVQDDNVHYTLSITTIHPEEVAEGAVVTLTVTFASGVTGTFENEIRITNGDIEALVIPLTVVYRLSGLDAVWANVSVYLAENGLLNIVGAPVNSPVSVFNAQGQTLLTAKIHSAHEQFDVPLPKGIYVVKVGEGSWKVYK